RRAAGQGGRVLQRGAGARLPLRGLADRGGRRLARPAAHPAGVPRLRPAGRAAAARLAARRPVGVRHAGGGADPAAARAGAGRAVRGGGARPRGAVRGRRPGGRGAGRPVRGLARTGQARPARGLARRGRRPFRGPADGARLHRRVNQTLTSSSRSAGPSASTRTVSPSSPARTSRPRPRPVTASPFLIDSSSRRPSRDQTGTIVVSGFRTVCTVKDSPVDRSRTRTWSISEFWNLTHGLSATHRPSGDTRGSSVWPTSSNRPEASLTNALKGALACR